MVGTLRVRPASCADIPAICGFVRELAEYEKLGHEVLFTQEQYLQYLFDSTLSPKPEVLIVESNAAAVGIALYIQISPKAIHLEDLFVAPSARGKGAGIALLSSLARVAMDRNVDQLQWMCLDWNKPSIDFYHSLGAEQVKDIVVVRLEGKALDADRESRVFSVMNTVIEVEGRTTLQRQIHSDQPDVIINHTLSFSTFKGTPVILVTEIVPETACVNVLVDRLIDRARKNGFARIDIRINTKSQHNVLNSLVNDFGAVLMNGWTPFRLSGDHVKRLAERCSDM